MNVSNKNKVFDRIFNRLLGLGIDSQTKLASILSISSASVWKAKDKNRFPKKWVSKLCKIYNKSPEWILGEQENPIGQTEVSLMKSLMSDIVELKIQLVHLEGTVSLLQGEIESLKVQKVATLKKVG